MREERKKNYEKRRYWKEMKGDKKRSGGALLQEKIQARSSSLTSSEMSYEGSYSELEVAKMPPTIQTLTECLHRIHALEKDDDPITQNNLQNR